MSTRRALLFSFMDRYSGLVVSIASSMIIARLLPPSDLGVFSVAMALLMLANTVRDMGAGQYLVQVPELTPARINAVWTIQLSIGLLLGLLSAALARPAAAFYAEPRMVGIFLVMALGYLVNPFGSITYAMLIREMRFERLAVMRLCSALVGACTSIGLALNGAGVISLAWGNLASIVTNALVARFVRPANVRLRLTRSGIRDVIGFGGRIAGTSIVNTAVNATPDFVLGKFQGMHEAGLYSRSNGLVAMFARLVTDAIHSVAVGLFARRRREGLDVAPGFLQAISYVTALSWTFFSGLSLLALPLTRVLYGSQWDGSVDLTRWLALAGALAAPLTMCTAICTALGRADILVRATVVSGLITAPAMAVGAFFGLDALGKLLALSSGCSAIAWLVLARPAVGFHWLELLRAVAPSLAVAALAMVGQVSAVMLLGLDSSNPLPVLLASTAGGLLCGMVGLLLTAHPLRQELQGVLKRLPFKSP